MIFYFSGTGNSAWVAQQLADSLHEEAIPVVEALRSSSPFMLRSNEALGFVFPVYAWGPPKEVLQLVKRLQLSSVPGYVFFVCTCGDDAGRTAQVLTAALRHRGWFCAAGWSVTMPNTYVALPGFDVDDPEVEEQKVANAKERVRFIADELQNRVQMKRFNCYEGTAPFTKTYVLRPFFQAFLMSPKPFRSTDACVACGKCERVCPKQNIQLTEGHPVWGDDCAHCMACYHVCPMHAVAYGRLTQGKGQYRRFL